MNLLRKTLTRRAALSASTAGLALAALGWWSRSAVPAAARSEAAASTGPVATVTASGVPVTAETAAAETNAAPAAAPAASHTAVVAGAPPVQPADGAGLFDVDPDQSSVNQDPHVVVTSDIAALPLDMEF